MKKQELATNYFKAGYNCSQSIVLAFKDELNLDESTLLKIASPFGGGMGRLREVCGAVTGCFIVLGLLYGYDKNNDIDGKEAVYKAVQEIAETFEKENGSIICRELLGLDHKRDTPTPEKRTEAYYTNRPCPMKVGSAAKILEDYINNHPYHI